MYMKKVGFLSLCTPILAYAGFPSARTWTPSRKQAGGSCPGCVIFVGTYLGSAIIAEVILKALGQI